VLRNIEDGVATLTAEGTAGVSSKSSQVAKDSVAALLVSQGKDPKGAVADSTRSFPNFIYSVLHDLVRIHWNKLASQDLPLSTNH